MRSTGARKRLVKDGVLRGGDAGIRLFYQALSKSNLFCASNMASTGPISRTSPRRRNCLTWNGERNWRRSLRNFGPTTRRCSTSRGGETLDPRGQLSYAPGSADRRQAASSAPKGEQHAPTEARRNSSPSGRVRRTRPSRWPGSQSHQGHDGAWRQAVAADPEGWMDMGTDRPSKAQPVGGTAIGCLGCRSQSLDLRPLAPLPPA